MCIVWKSNVSPRKTFSIQLSPSSVMRHVALFQCSVLEPLDRLSQLDFSECGVCMGSRSPLYGTHL